MKGLDGVLLRGLSLRETAMDEGYDPRLRTALYRKPGGSTSCHDKFINLLLSSFAEALFDDLWEK
jgi:hypothetical protein